MKMFKTNKLLVNTNTGIINSSSRATQNVQKELIMSMKSGNSNVVEQHTFNYGTFFKTNNGDSLFL